MAPFGSRSTISAALGAAAILAAGLGASPAQAQNFASTIAVNGREAFIGQPANNYGPGLVYLYRPNAQGVWAQTGRLAAPDSSLGDGFGRSVAADGNTLMVLELAAFTGRGVVHVFERPSAAAAWRHATTIASPDSANRFGVTLAVKGDLALIGATGTDSARGALHIYRRTGPGAWTRDTTLLPDSAAPNTAFGGPVAIQGDMFVVGAAGADSNVGSAYIYRRAGNGWTRDAKLRMPGLPAQVRQSRFGQAVLIDGQTIYVGAPGLNNNLGVVVAFRHDSATNTWRPNAQLMPFEAAQFTQFGVSLARVGNELWVGAPGVSQFQGAIMRYSRASDTSAFTTVSRLNWDSAGQVGFGGGRIVAGQNMAVVGIPNAEGGEGLAAVMTRDAGGAWRQRTLTAPVMRPAAVTGRDVACTSGKAGMFDCQQTALLSFLPVEQIGGGRGTKINDIWGWTDPQTGKEYALVGRTDGTAFVDISNPNRPRYLGSLPKTKTSPASVWRDLKVYRNHVFIVADGAREHGMQVFDLTRLRRAGATPQQFTEDAHYSRVNSAHNIAIDTMTGYAFIVGASSGGETCGGGLHMVNLQNPKHPEFAGCFADPNTGRASTGYSHDAQCVVYHGPDARYTGKHICLGANETALSIADVTDKANPKAVGRGSYPNVGYSHQGWLTEDQRYLYMNDELDELQGKVNGTRTIIWDLQKLDDPVVVGEYIAPIKASDHNLYIKGNRMYQSNYQGGLRIVDITDRVKPKEVGYFDTVPVGENNPGFGGSWSNYPFFKSGTIIVTSGSEGLFMVRDTEVQPVP